MRRNCYDLRRPHPRAFGLLGRATEQLGLENDLQASVALPATSVAAPSPGFLVVIYDGDYYSYSITPIASDGSLGGQSVRVVWSVEQHAYVLG